MGLFDVPAPIFAWIDALAAALIPPLGRLILWGIVAALVSMGLYWLLSAQKRIGRAKTKLAQSRAQLDAYDGEFAGAAPLIGNLLRSALHQVGLVAWPAILSSLPLLALICWLSTAYGYSYPAPGTEPTIQTQPPQLQTQWIEGARNKSASGQGAAPRILVAGIDQEILAEVPLPAPVPVIHKWQWWNVLIGNPAGYLPSNAAVDWIEVALPDKEYLGFGPSWLRGWEAPFFISLIVVSIVVKIWWRID
ncbi:MAG: hypothetical protein L0H63_05740 [Nitrococcus sp.]|nr:hypothetical protein [Nitrococcus sp.]